MGKAIEVGRQGRTLVAVSKDNATGEVVELDRVRLESAALRHTAQSQPAQAPTNAQRMVVVSATDTQVTLAPVGNDVMVLGIPAAVSGFQVGQIIDLSRN